MGALTDFIDSTLKAAGYDAPGWVDLTIASVIGSVIMFTAVFATGGLFTFAFRKIFAHMGQRVGPNRVGPFGILQFLADGLKLIGKEDVKPAKADSVTWRGAVYVAAVPIALAWAPLPFGEGVFFTNIGTGILFILAVSAISPLGEIMAGWGSNNKYSLYGGVRAAALDVSYEIPLMFSVASVLLIVGSLGTQDIVTAQEGMWFILPQIVGFVIFFIGALAKAGLVPTDLAESESELVAGFTTEYSGMRFGTFFVILFSNVFFVSALMTMLFLGGWQAPFGSLLPVLNTFAGAATGVLWFVAKSLLMSFVVFWVWSTLPRVRVDQYLNMAWKVMLPLSILNFVVTAVLVRMEVLG
ncbi:MAG: NADH-quinone oxidoreductase subunit NuoH [Thermoplasmatota archaeon]